MATAIRAVNAANSGGGRGKDDKLRIGVFELREKAALAYEISREFLKADKGSEPVTQENRSLH
jgi:hypothetical protein